MFQRSFGGVKVTKSQLLRVEKKGKKTTKLASLSIFNDRWDGLLNYAVLLYQQRLIF